MHRFALLASVVLCLLGSTASAAEALDVLDCRSGTVNMLHASKELAIYSFDLKGVLSSLNDNKALHASSVHCIGMTRSEGGERIANGYCKWQDADGDLIFGQWRLSGPERGPWSFIGGTGKWKGVTGSGEWMDHMRAKPIEPGTFQNCIRVTGNYTRAP